MPRIPTLGFQTRPAGPVEQPRASAEGMGAAATGMRQLGRGISESAQVLHEINEKQAAFEAELQAVETENVARERLNQLKQEAPEGAEGFTDKVSEEFESWLPELMDKAPDSNRARKVLQARYAGLKSELITDAQRFQAESKTALDLRRFGEAQTGLMNQARAYPERMDDLLRRAGNLTAGAPFPDEQSRAKHGANMRLGVINSTLDGWVTKFETETTDAESVTAAIGALKSGAYGFRDEASSDVYDQALTRLQNRRSSLDVESKASFGKDLADAKVTIQNHGYIPENITYSRALKVFDGDEKAAKRVMDELNSDMRVYGLQQKMANTSRAEDEATAQALFAETKGEGAAYKQQDLQEFLRASQAKWGAIGNDMTGYALQKNPGLARTRNEALRMPSGSPEERAERQNALDSYYTKLEATLDTLGLPKYLHRIIPKGEALDLTARINGMGAEDAADTMAQLSAEYGPRYPLAMRQLQEMGVDPTALELGSLVGVGDAGLRKKAAGYVQKGQSELRKVIGGTNASEIDSYIVEVSAPFNATLSGTRDGLDIIGRKTEMMRTLAYGIYMDGGVKSKEAVQRAYNQLIGNRWDTAETFLTPKGLLGATERAAARALAKASPDRFAPIGPGTMDPSVVNTEAGIAARRQAAYVNARTNGKWLNSPDGNGVMLFVPDGPGSATYSPLKLLDGSFVEVRFADIRANPELNAPDELESGTWAVRP